ncbi:uncharacterized protein SCHCODRAFT_02686193 [Schizophyllum commune H4-8]|uniref:Fungal-type protein kinase domain-containing protein n=1 Tax=Schizophyllum commune (strain H4-8 / FGSC 9210) TaxID=578458 RepID=D8Q2U3_SCHCM|nr:uncharacterized protein SCHCODRAFT_02686193 [Schizophyllum commune H4-8]KAI5894617.1 hypothetical protein SCHCODRAFT_02686193 [Schizophyllum commune H4-8]
MGNTSKGCDGDFYASPLASAEYRVASLQNYPQTSLTPLPIQPLPDLLALRANELEEIKRHTIDVKRVHATLFPDDRFPLKPRAMVRALDRNLYDLKARRWLSAQFYPPTPLSSLERVSATAAFLNEITRCCWLAYAALRLPSSFTPRQWTVAETSRTSATGDVDSHYSLVLADAGLRTLRWQDVLCDVEIVADASELPEALQRLSSGAAHVLATQDDRIFHLGLALAGDKYQLAYFDCAGRVLSAVYDMHEYPMYFLRILMGLTMLDKSSIGKDPSFVSRGGQRFLTVANREYEVIETLAIDKRVIGHGTVYWRCRRENGNDVIVKSAWANVHQSPTEGDLFRAACSCRGTPELVCEERVFRSDGKPWSTMWIRDTLSGQDRLRFIRRIRPLELRRLVLDSTGRPLKEFASKDELLLVLKDTIRTHETMFRSGRRILQCNISDTSIMLHQPSSSPRRRGLFVDLSRAAWVSGYGPDGFVSVGSRTDCLPFQACHLTRQPDSTTHHLPQHDLESYIHLLMYICASYSGPSNTPRKNFDIRDSPMAPWYNSDSEEKCRIMTTLPDVEFRGFLDDLFDPYFDDLKGLVCELRTLLLRRCDRGRPPDHEDVLEVFDRHIAALQTPPLQPEPAPAPRQRALEIPMAVETRRKGFVKRKLACAPLAERAALAAATPPPAPAMPIATLASPTSPTAAPTAPSPVALPPAVARPSPPPPQSTSRTIPSPRPCPSRPMTRAMKRRLAESRRAVSPPSDDSDRTLVDTTPERKGSLPESPSPKRKLSPSPSSEDRRPSPRRSKRLASPDAPSDEPPLQATRASKRRKVA